MPHRARRLGSAETSAEHTCFANVHLNGIKAVNASDDHDAGVPAWLLVGAAVAIGGSLARATSLNMARQRETAA
jgi:hypothetical protein